MDRWELEAREQIRHTIIAYAVAGDRGRLSDVAEQFTEDGTLEVKGRGIACGRNEILSMLSGRREDGQPSGDEEDGFFRRHFITNILITEIGPAEAHSVSYFAVLTPSGLDHWGRYRDRLRPSGGRWLLHHRTVRVDSSSDKSWYRHVYGKAGS